MLATLATLGETRNLIIDPSGSYLYMADSTYHIVRRVSLSTGIISTAISQAACSPQPCIQNPRGFVFDAAGNLFIASSNYHKVFVWNASTSAVTVVAGNGTSLFSGDLRSATSATLNSPEGLAIYQNALYISDTANHRIRKVDFATGIITTIAGGGPHGDGQVATDSSLYTPRSLLFDASGNLFIVDGNGVQIRRVDAVTRIISTYAGTGGVFTGQISDPLNPHSCISSSCSLS